METIYIVLYRVSPTSKWQAKADGVLTEQRLAENFVEILRNTAPQGWQYAYVEGPIVSPESMAEVEKRLGEF